jgi:hypothetical protein
VAVTLLLADFGISRGRWTPGRRASGCSPPSSVTEHTQRLSFSSHATGRLLERVAFYLHVRGQYQQATPLAEQAVTVTEGPAPTSNRP